jgi:hypothetical protein
MRVLGPSVFALIPELTASADAGERLAAVSALQLIPDVRYLDWLADRFAAESPFIAYHAAVALLTAARELRPEELDKVDQALSGAERSTQSLGPGTDRAQTVNLARKELDRRTGR